MAANAAELQRARSKPGPVAPAIQETEEELLLLSSFGDKGGSTKSFTLRLLAALLIKRWGKDKVKLIDGDGAVNSLWRYYRHAELFSFHGALDERDKLVNVLLGDKAPLVVADMPATTITKLREISEEYNFLDAVRQAGYRMTLLEPITPYPEPTMDLQEVIRLFEPEAFAAFREIYVSFPELVRASEVNADENSTAEQVEFARQPVRARLAEIDAAFRKGAVKKTRANYVAALNLGYQAEGIEDFVDWNAPEAFTRRLLAFVGGVEIRIPKLRMRIASRLHAKRKSFYEGAQILSITDRSRLATFLEEAEAAFAPAAEWLGL